MTAEDTLKHSFFFENLSTAELHTISHLCQKKHVVKGEVLIESGEVLKKMYIIMFGTVVMNIERKDGIEETITVVGNDQIIGFEGYYDHGQKSLFTARAIESCEVLEIGYPQLEDLFNKNTLIAKKCLKSFHRFYSNIMHTLVAKLMDANASKFY